MFYLCVLYFLSFLFLNIPNGKMKLQNVWIRCTTFVIHFCCMFRPQDMVIFRELELSKTYRAYISSSLT